MILCYYYELIIIESSFDGVTDILCEFFIVTDLGRTISETDLFLGVKLVAIIESHTAVETELCEPKWDSLYYRLRFWTENCTIIFDIA
jgi:hypothetical protein